MTFDFIADAYYEDEDMARQQQQQQQQQIGFLPSAPDVTVEAVLCIPVDQARYLPKRARLPKKIPLNAIPRMGEAYYPVPDGSVWAVQLIKNLWTTPSHLRIEVWIVNVKHAYPMHVPPGFEMTQ